MFKNHLSVLLLLSALSCSNLETGYHTLNSPTSPRVLPQIEFDTQSCAGAALVTEVTVKTEKQNFTFSPSCKGRLYQSFLVENKLQCILESSMCAEKVTESFVQVHCKNGEGHTVHFPCQTQL
jgi:hypothetical protein